MEVNLQVLETWHVFGILVLSIAICGYYYGRMQWNIRTNDQVVKKAHERIDGLEKKLDFETNTLTTELKEMRKEIMEKLNDMNSRLVRLETLVNGHNSTKP